MNYNKNYFYFLLASLLFWLPYAGIAQNYLPYSQKFTMEDGLSSPYLESLLQDSRGVIWLGTNYGLNRYDGTSIKNYTQEEDGLCHNTIREISEDGNGNLWILAGGFTRVQQFICIFDPIAEVFYSVEEYTGAICPFDPNRTNLLPAYKGVLILSEETDSAYHIFEVNKNRLTQAFSVSKSDSLLHVKNILEVVKMNHDAFLVSAYRYSDHQPQNILFNSRGEVIEDFYCPHANYSNLMDVASGRLFYYCAGSEALEENLMAGSVVSIYIDGQKKDLIDPLPYEAIIPTKDHIYLIEKGRKSISIYDQESLKLVQRVELDQKIANTYWRWFADQVGGIWHIGNNAIHRLSLREQFFEQPFQDENEGIFRRIRGIATSPAGKIYTGGNVVNTIDDPLNKPGWATIAEYIESTMGLLYDDGTIWMAMDGDGSLKQYFPETGKTNSYNVPYEVESQILLWMPYKAPDGRLWVGGAKGLLKLDTLTNELRDFKDYNGFTELTTSSVYAFHRNDKGTWLSTSSGLYLADLEREKILAHYSDARPAPYYFPGYHIAHTYEDREGVFWLATKGQGLIRWDPATGESEQLTRKNTGLSHNVIYAVYEDDFGNLWLPSNYGLMCLNKESRQVTVYLEEDGLPHTEFNTIAHHRDKDGRLYFGTQNGLISFHPKDIQQSQTAAPLILTSCYRVDRKTDSLINETAQVIKQHVLTIQPGDKTANFSFALLDYDRPKANEYSYKIAGYHQDWHYQKEASMKIGGLPYGKYQFRLRAKSSGSNTWVEYQQPIELIFARPFYFRWWALSLAFLTLAATLYFIRKYQTRQLMAHAERRRLQELDSLKTKMYTNITHEFRTPLTVILGISQNIRDSLGSISAEAINDNLHVVQRNGKHLLNLINQMLDLAKLDKGSLYVNWELGDVILFLQYLSESFCTYAATKKIQLTFYPESRSLEMDYDREKLQYIVFNLLSNALKFTPEGGKVVFHAQEIPAGKNTDDPLLQLKISNTGPGIAAAHLPHIFDRFYQADDSTTLPSDGTGIGLALTKDLVELLGGSITAKSEPGKWTEFTLLLPVWKTALPNPEPLQVETAAAPTRTQAAEMINTAPIADDQPLLLLIEDNADVAAYISSCVKDPYTVLWAENGQLGIDKALEIIPDIIISDVMMPEKDGYEVIRFLKNDERTSHIPIILLTAKATTEDRITGLERGADAYLSKPFDRKELQVQIDQLVTLRRQLQAYYVGRAASGLEKVAVPKPGWAIEKDVLIEDAFLKKVNDIIEEHLSETEFEVPQLSQELAMSHSQLYRKIKALTGQSIAGYIRTCRLHQGRILLQTTDQTISEIAYHVGFSAPSYFSKKYLETYGKTPSDERK